MGRICFRLYVSAKRIEQDSNAFFSLVFQEHQNEVASGVLPTLQDLNVANLTKVEEKMPWLLKPHRQHGYYEEKLGEYADPAPPVAVA